MNDSSDSIIITASLVATTLSVVGCLFNIITTIYLKKYDLATNKMVVYLSLADLATSIVLIPILGSNMSSNSLCLSLTFILNFGHGSSFVLTCCFAHALNMAVKSDPQNLINYLKFYKITSIIAGTVLGTVSVVMDMGYIVNDMCTLGSAGSGFDWGDLFIVVIPLAASVVYCGTIYILFIRQLREMGVRPSFVLLSYPAILMLCYLPYLIYSYVPSVPFWFIFAGRTLINSQGLLNSLAYGVSKEIFNEYRNRCCRKREEKPQSNYQTSPKANKVERGLSTIEMFGVL